MINFNRKRNQSELISILTKFERKIAREDMVFSSKMIKNR
jgi:hypothetical protein